MPAIEAVDLNQKAILWPNLGVDSFGDQTVSLPQEVCVRWKGGRSERLNAQGQTIGWDATAIVRDRVDSLSMMLLGSLEDFATNTSRQFFQVKEYYFTPDIKARETRRKVGLMRFRGVLPKVIGSNGNQAFVLQPYSIWPAACAVLRNPLCFLTPGIASAVIQVGQGPISQGANAYQINVTLTDVNGLSVASFSGVRHGRGDLIAASSVTVPTNAKSPLTMAAVVADRLGNPICTQQWTYSTAPGSAK